MKKAEVIVRKYADKLIVNGYLKKVFELQPSVVGIAKLDKVDDNLTLRIGADHEDINIENFERAQKELQKEDVLFHFGHVPLSFDNPETLQPFVLYALDDAAEDPEPAVVTFIEGNFPDFEKDAGDHSVEYMVFREFLKPFFDKLMAEAGGDWGKLLENLENDKVSRRSLDNLCTGRGAITLLGIEGKGPITFGTNPQFKQFDWGQVSNHLGFEDVVVAPSVGARLNKKAAQLFSLKSSNKTEAPAQQEPKADTTPVPQATAPTKPKFTLGASNTSQKGVKDTAMAEAAKVKPTEVKKESDEPSDATHTFMAPPHNVTGSNALKKWYRKYSYNAALPTNFHEKPKVWVENKFAVRIVEGQTKAKENAERAVINAQERLKTFQDINPKDVKTVERPIIAATEKPKEPAKDTMAKHLPASPPLQPAKEPLLVLDPKAKRQLDVFVNTLYDAKVLDHSSRAVLKPKEIGDTPKNPTFQDLTGMEDHELFRIPGEARAILIRECPDAANLLMDAYRRLAGSRMTDEELNPAVEETDEQKYNEFATEKGAIPAVEEKKVAAGGGKFKFRLSK